MKKNLRKKIKFTEPAYNVTTGNWVRQCYVNWIGITKVGKTKTKLIVGSIVNRIKHKTYLYPKKVIYKHIENCLKEIPNKMRSGVEGRRGYFKVLDFVLE